MSLETVPTVNESAPEMKQEQIRRVVDRFQSLVAAEPEATELLLHGRPPTCDEERDVAACMLVEDACAGEAEACGQRGERHAERAARMLEQMLEAERTLRGLYYDAQQDSVELAELMRARHPELFESANDTSFVEKEAA